MSIKVVKLLVKVFGQFLLVFNLKNIIWRGEVVFIVWSIL